MKVSEYLGHWSSDSEIISSFIFQDLLRLLFCRINAPNYRQNDKFLESCFFVNKLVVGNSLRYFNKNQRKSLVAKDVWSFPRSGLEYESVFPIYVFLKHKKKMQQFNSKNFSPIFFLTFFFRLSSDANNIQLCW